MLGEFVMRLAVALPLVCGLAAVCLWAVKRGRLRLPMLPAPGRALMLRGPGRGAVGTPLLDVLDVRALSPVARLAVIRFDGRMHLVGVAGQTISLLTPGPARDAPDGGDAP